MGAGGGVAGEEEDAAGAGPEMVERVFGFEDDGGVGPEGAVPEAVDAAVDEVDLLAGVEDESGAGGKFSVEDDEIVGTWLGLLRGIDCKREILGAEDRIEADEAFVGGEQGDDHSGGQGEIGGVGESSAAQEIADGADGEHGQGYSCERTTEEAHGGAGEIEEVTEREVVGVRIAGEQGGDIGAGGGMPGEDGEVAADENDDGGEGEEEIKVPAEGAGLGAAAVWSFA